MNTPIIPISWGELLDKITILQIKTCRLHAPEAQLNASSELQLLRQAVSDTKIAPELEAALLAVNTRLWCIEDLLRRKEAVGDFGAAFIALARSVYRENDERARIKRAVNHSLGSALVEEKQYARY